MERTEILKSDIRPSHYYKSKKEVKSFKKVSGLPAEKRYVRVEKEKPQGTSAIIRTIKVESNDLNEISAQLLRKAEKVARTRGINLANSTLKNVMSNKNPATNKGMALAVKKLDQARWFGRKAAAMGESMELSERQTLRNYLMEQLLQEKFELNDKVTISTKGAAIHQDLIGQEGYVTAIDIDDKMVTVEWENAGPKTLAFDYVEPVRPINEE